MSAFLLGGVHYAHPHHAFVSQRRIQHTRSLDRVSVTSLIDVSLNGSGNKHRQTLAACNPKPHTSECLKTIDGSAVEANIPATAARKIGWKKVLGMIVMFFCILFNFTILRDTKDVLIITAPGSGAEVIPFLKTWGVVPTAVLFVVAYSHLSDLVSSRVLFYSTLAPFLAFFAAFPTLLYPNRSWLHPHALADSLRAVLPFGLQGPLSIVEHWTFSVFYIMAELWGSVILSLCFWGFANEVTKVDEAKKVYPLFGVFANVALVVAGMVVKAIGRMRLSLPDGVDAWGMSLTYLNGVVVLSGLILCVAYEYARSQAATEASAQQGEASTVPKQADGARPAIPASEVPRHARETTGRGELQVRGQGDATSDKSTRRAKKPKAKMSFLNSLRLLAQSPHLRNLAILVLSYGLCINVVEVSWKSQLKQAFPDPNDYAAFMGDFSATTGVVTLIMMVLGRVILDRFGWGVAAQTTPLVILVTGGLFFALTIFRESLAPLIARFGTTPLMLSVFVGAAQNILSKATKYSLFDPTKEMAYIPLSPEMKTKGKAAIDVVASRLGKSGGSLLQQVLLLSLGSLTAATPILSVVFTGIVVLWVYSAKELANQLQDLLKCNEQNVADSSS
eukprot:Rmarinus@m.10181